MDYKTIRKKYREEDRGRFEVSLIRNANNTEVAYTSGNIVKLTKDFNKFDTSAVELFASNYDLEIEED